MNELKTCVSCLIPKSLEEFYTSLITDNRTYYKPKCKVCYRRPIKDIADLYGEIWKDVIGYEGLYQISDKGRLKSVLRNYKSSKMVVSIPERLLKSSISYQGYPAYSLFKNFKKKRFHIHRLVAIHFIPNPDNKPDINHINGIKTDFSLVNLEWVTKKENIMHAFKTGLMPPVKKGSESHKAKKVINTITKEVYGTINEASLVANVNRCTLVKWINDKTSPYSFSKPQEIIAETKNTKQDEQSKVEKL